MRTTETQTVEYVSSNIDLNGNYITNVEVDAGNLFDIGFRIGDGIATPDDLFMSDGPWGYDDAAASTSVTNYTIEENEEGFDDTDYPVERNISLTAKTKEYIAAYRALTPKFNSINLTAYNSLQFTAKGTGTLIVRLVKEGVTNWESQYKATVNLTENYKDYAIAFEDFKTTDGSSIQPTDVTSIVYTMLADSGEEETKEMTFKQVRFSQSKSLSTTSESYVYANAVAVPNPMQNATTVTFYSKEQDTVNLLVYNQLGTLIKQKSVEAINGENRVLLTKENLSSGLYLVKIKSNTTTYKTIKLLIK
ncbi:T9SS type A sorting domain-containing protein [Seonamhaeicola sp.]|uniref:T9SS type A sorting domain-containing protein n=1 Tax=Seonamhaeicola sp. TaxID=1912245 RepID=UPI003567FF91